VKMVAKRRIQIQICMLCFPLLIVLQLSVLKNLPPQAFPATSLVYDYDSITSNALKMDRRSRRCAFNLFGLPRSFKDLVLPTMIKNVIIPNIQYDCDYFVHFYNVTYEPPSRSGKGGPIMPEDVYLLREAVHRIAVGAGRQLPHVGFMLDKEENFERKHADLLRKVRRNHRLTWKHDGYTVVTGVNIIKMWYSISSVWDFMKEHESFQNMRYKRVAMLRSDVVYLTPIDIFTSAPDGVFDNFNNRSVIPGFARSPVNDRMFYGPYEASKIWATGRFPRFDDYIFKSKRYLHSERFLRAAILPEIRAQSISVDEDPSICFWRARADQSVWVDCGGLGLKALLESLLKRSCSVLPANLSDNAEQLPVLNCSTW
jgi:hypothetical protein